MPFLPRPGLAPSRRQVYLSAQRRYVDFCHQDDWLGPDGALLRADKQTLIHFATFLADSLNHLCWIRRPGRGVLSRGMPLLGHSGSSSSSFNHSSINVYISAVQSLHINNGLPDLLINCLQLQRLLRGVKRVQGSSSLNRLPISIDILHVVKRALNLYSRDQVMLWAASWLGFFGFLANLLLIHRLSRAFIWGLVMCRPIPWGILRVSQNSHQAFKDGSLWCWLWHLQVYIGRGNNSGEWPFPRAIVLLYRGSSVNTSAAVVLSTVYSIIGRPFG